MNIKNWIQNKVPSEIIMCLSALRGMLQRKTLKNPYRKINDSVHLGAALKNFKVHLEKKSSVSLPASDRWEFYLRNIREIIPKFSSVKDVVSYAQRKIAFDHRNPSGYIASHLPVFEGILEMEFPQFVDEIKRAEESLYSVNESLRMYRGRWVSNILYCHLRTVLQCLLHVKQPKVVAEIGGGYGAPARIWMTNQIHRPDVYILIDFPECLFFAEVFLQLTVPEAKILSISDVHDDLPADPHIILCPIHEIDQLKKFSLDLVVNTGSMQEMTDEWIDFWMNWLDTIDVHYFYSMNYFCQPLSNLEEGANIWSPRLSRNWEYRICNANPGFLKAQSPRNFAEIVAEKTNEDSQPSKKELLAQYKFLSRRSMDIQTFLEMMNIIRIYPDEEIMWEVLNRVRCEMPVLPKEILHLSQYLKEESSSGFQKKNKKHISEIHESLEKIYASACKNRIV